MHPAYRAERREADDMARRGYCQPDIRTALMREWALGWITADILATEATTADTARRLQARMGNAA